MASIKTVAEQAHVSIATVSRVLNGTKHVSSDIEKRVLEAVTALNYQPNVSARSLRRQRTLSVGILLPQLNDFFLGSVAYALEKALYAEGYSPLFCSTENNEEKEMISINNLISHRVDAVVMMPSAPIRKSVKSVGRLLDEHIPVVLIDRSMLGFKVNQVRSNNAQGGYDGAEFLLQLGHRHIGIIDSVFDEAHYAGEPGHDRTNGIQRAMLDWGLPFDPSLSLVDKLPNITVGYEGAMRLLRQSPHITAIFALTDVIAVGVLRAAFELGLNVPHDLSVIGFDDIVLASHVIPRLTTIAQPIDKIGQKAVELLLRQIHDPATPPETVMLDTKLIIRESTAAPRS